MNPFDPPPGSSPLPEAYVNEYNRIRAQGDDRDIRVWLRDHIAAHGDSNPEMLSFLNGTPAPAAASTEPPAITNTGNLTPEQVQSLQAFVASSPEQAQILTQLGGDLEAYGNFVVNWWQDEQNMAGNTPSPQEQAIFNAYGYELEGGDDEVRPFEEAFGNQVINDYVIPDIDRDRQRQADADRIISDYTPALNASRGLINDVTVQRIDAEQYLAQNPDLIEYYNANRQQDGSVPGFPNVRGVQDFAQAHWETYGRAEGRQGAGTPRTQLLRDEMEFSRGVTGQQLDSLGRQVGSIGNNITTEESSYWNNLMRERDGLTANLGTQVEGLRRNLGEFDTARRGNLETQLGELADAQAEQVGARGTAITQQVEAQRTSLQQLLNGLRENLDGEMSAKAAALQQQLDTLYNGLNTFTAAEKDALAAQLQDNFASLEAEVGSRKTALEQELATMGSAITVQSAARREALQAELTKLTAAQQPLNEARIQGAEALGTAINLGVQSERDRIVAETALQGYVGGSTSTDQALLRASLSGRQDAARAVADAREANALDDRDLTRYGAGAERGIAEAEAADNRGLAFYGAGQTRGNTTYEAAGRRSLADFGAAGRRAIDSADANARLGLTEFGAGQERDLAYTEAEGIRRLGDFGDESERGIADFESGQRRLLSDFDSDNTRARREFGAGQTRLISDETDRGYLDIGNFGVDQTRGISDRTTTGERAIFDRTAGQRRQLGDFTADETRGIEGAQTERDYGYFNADIQRRLAALSLPANAVATEFGVRTAADQYGQSGLGRAFNNLRFFQTGGGQAPNAVTPNFGEEDASGSFYSNLGAGLIGLGGNIGNSTGWQFTRRPPASTTPNPNTVGPGNPNYVPGSDDDLG